MIDKKKYAELYLLSRSRKCRNDSLEILENDPPLLLDDKAMLEAYSVIDEAINMNMGIVTIDEPAYPTLLLEYHAHPLLLFYFGDIERINDFDYRLAVVGSRNCTIQGKDDINRMITGLRGENVAIISGLARGIDGVAHKAALNNNLFTVGVLASGADVCYPPEHKAIYNEIRKRGVIISENPPGARPLKQYFPARNRIIAGIADAILVGEAGIKSGALITAELGLDDGRTVMSIPQSINSIYGAGCNDLLKTGADCVTCTADVMLGLGMDVSKCMSDKIDISGLPEDEKTVYSILAHSKGLNEDQIYNRSLMNISAFKAALIKLQLKNFVRRRDDGIYIAEI